MERLLIHPPFADPTQPYLSLPTLKGYLRGHGLDARVLDLNLEAAHHLLDQSVLNDLARRMGLRFLELNAKQELDFHEQREYRAIVEARPKMEEILAADPPPIAVFQSRELFYDAAAYAIARRRVEGFFDALSAIHHPFRFGFNRASHDVVPWSFDLLESYAREARSPLEHLYRQVFDPPEDWSAVDWDELRVDLAAVDFIGISIVFPSQIPEAFYLARFLKQRAPHAFVALGGPCLHQVVIHQDDAIRRRVLGWVDGVGLFEGEATLAQLFPRLEQWRAAETDAERAAALLDVANLLVWDGRAQQSRLGPRHVMDLHEAPAPDYSDLDLDRYLAPSRILLYAPTRGCYWNRCSFCYYGLSETATARYREVPPARAAADLAKLAQRYGVKHFYVSCDVLSPAYAVHFAEALIERGVKIRWSSDLKIEKYFTPERCEILFRSGMRSAAFGIESGSNRILALMQKGCDRETMTEVNRAFHRALIATEWMTFTDHPSETVAEALDTVKWIATEREFIDLFLVGEFGLEQGSHIAQEPERYGVERIFFAEGDELKLYALFTQKQPERTPAEREQIDREIEAVARGLAMKPYPWAGAISTHHTFLHFLEFGQSAFRTHFQQAPTAHQGAMPPPPLSHLAGLRQRPRFSVRAIAAREEQFFAQYLPRALFTTIAARRSGGTTDVAPLSAAHFAQAAAQVKPLRGGSR
ncbi:MAG: radical SAM protein [Planctomycetota bacterium]